MALRTDYKDDILDISKNEKRKYNMITNSDGTVSFEDVTVYSQVGDTFGAADVNKITAALNNTEGSVRYNSETDMIQIRDAEGNWHDWASGGLQIFDVNEIALDDWIKEADSMLSSSSLLSVNPFVGRTVGNNISYNQGAKWTTRNAYELSGFKYARISYSGVNQGGDKTYSQANGKSKISIINAETGVETVIKEIISNNSSFDDNVALVNLSGKYKIAITASSNGSVTSTLTVNCLKFSRNML